MKTALFFGCLLVAAALTPRDDRILIADDALGFYNRYVYCEVNNCNAWGRPWHVHARALRRVIRDDETFRREVADNWRSGQAPRWMMTLLR